MNVWGVILGILGAGALIALGVVIWAGWKALYELAALCEEFAE